jgi:hypothetical protein
MRVDYSRGTGGATNAEECQEEAEAASGTLPTRRGVAAEAEADRGVFTRDTLYEAVAVAGKLGRLVERGSLDQRAIEQTVAIGSCTGAAGRILRRARHARHQQHCFPRSR